MKLNKITPISLRALILAGAFFWTSVEAMNGKERDGKVKEEVEVSVAGQLAPSDQRPKIDPSRFDEATRVTKTPAGTLKLENLKTRKVLVLNPDRTAVSGNDIPKLITYAEDLSPEGTAEAQFSEVLGEDQVKKFKEFGAVVSQDGKSVSAKGGTARAILELVSRDKYLSENAFITLKDKDSLPYWKKMPTAPDQGEYFGPHTYQESSPYGSEIEMWKVFFKDRKSVDFYKNGPWRVAYDKDGSWAKTNSKTGKYAFLDLKAKAYSTNDLNEMRTRLNVMREAQSQATVDLEWPQHSNKLLAVVKTLPHYLTGDGKFGVKGASVSEAYETIRTLIGWGQYKDLGQGNVSFSNSLNRDEEYMDIAEELPKAIIKNLSDTDVDALITKGLEGVGE